MEEVGEETAMEVEDGEVEEEDGVVEVVEVEEEDGAVVVVTIWTTIWNISPIVISLLFCAIGVTTC